MARTVLPSSAPTGTAGAERPKRKPAATGNHLGTSTAPRTRTPRRDSSRSGAPPRYSRPLPPALPAEHTSPRAQPELEREPTIDGYDASADERLQTPNPHATETQATPGAAAGGLSQLKLSPSPTLIFEIDAGGLDDGPAAGRAEVRLVGSVRNRRRAQQDSGERGSSEVSAVLIIKALAPTRLLACVRAVRRGGSVPPELLSQLMPIAENEHPGFRPEELTSRELDVLRMLADGLTTREIAEEMSYSERTVKKVVHDLLEKLNCRTRAHAVALTTRHGVI